MENLFQHLISMNKVNSAIIFDMDGVLLDTEPLWGESMMRVAKSYHIKVSMAELRFTTGLRIHEVTAFWKEKFPWGTSASSNEVAEAILDDIIDNSIKNATVMPGIIDNLQQLKSNQIHIGVATSSPRRMADQLLKHFGIFDFFGNISTGDQCRLGKPHPEVYEVCANALNVPSFNCIAVEDSVNGMVAAKAIRMKVLAVPEAAKLSHPAFGLADKVIPSMKHWSFEKWWDL